MTSGTKERVDLLSKLADSWIRLGQTGEGLRTDEYVNKHREAIMGIYEYCGKSLKEYLNYEPALAAVEREGARANEAGIAEGMRMCAEFLEREADANFMPNEPTKQLIRGMATAIRVNMKAFVIGERTAQSPVAPAREAK